MLHTTYMACPVCGSKDLHVSIIEEKQTAYKILHDGFMVDEESQINEVLYRCVDCYECNTTFEDVTIERGFIVINPLPEKDS